MKISVIIPVYNNPTGLKRCVDALYKQSKKFDQLVVVDNNSTDTTKEVIFELKKKYKNIIYLFVPKRSRAAARNAGIKKAAGDIIVMLDSDCVAHKDWLMQLTNPIVKKQEVICVGQPTNISRNYWEKNRNICEQKYLKKCLNGTYMNNLWFSHVAIRRSILKTYSFDDQLVTSEDLDLYLRIPQKVKYTPLAKIHVEYENTLRNVISKSFLQGFWHTKIYLKHHKPSIHQFNSQKFTNMLTFPFWLLCQYVKQPFGLAFYLHVRETAFRLGVLYARISTMF